MAMLFFSMKHVRFMTVDTIIRTAARRTDAR
jgi:hypothetical protein